MKSQLVKEEGLKRVYDVTLPAATVDKAFNDEVAKLSKTMKVKGFRPGKVPPKYVLEKYGDDIVIDLKSKLVRSTGADVVAKEKLQPVLEPSFDVQNFELGKDAKFKMELEVFPEIPKIDLAKIKLTKNVAEPTDKEVDEAIQKIAGQNKDFETPKTRKKAKMGDMAILDFTGSIAGKEFDGGKAEKQSLVLGSGRFIPGFEEGVEGLEVGGEKTIKVKFPDDYQSKDLAGKDAEFAIKLHEIKEPTDAKIDDEFAKKFGQADLKALKDIVKAQVQREIDEITGTLLKKDLLDVLEKDCKFEAPQVMLNYDIKSIEQQLKRENDSLPKKEQKTEAQLKKDSEKLGLRRVKLGILLSGLGKQLNIQVNNNEVSQHMAGQAQSFNVPMEQLVDFYQKNNQAFDQLKGEILENKVVEHIYTKADIKDKKVSPDELNKLEQELENSI